MGEDIVGGYGIEGGVVGVLVACRVVDGDLLNLRARVQEQATYGREDDADGEEEGEDGLWCEDWSDAWSALSGRSAHSHRLTAMPSAAAVETQCLLVDAVISYMFRKLRRSFQSPLLLQHNVQQRVFHHSSRWFVG